MFAGNKAGMIANTSHPKGLGSSLTHPMITTDYSEALLEFITPPEEDLNAPFNILTDLHQYTLYGFARRSLMGSQYALPITRRESNSNSRVWSF